MSTNPPNPPLQFYPSYCFVNSPTYHVWAKLTAADVHALTARPEFVGTSSPASRLHWSLIVGPPGRAAQDTYFYLNHPIRWVCVTGVVVAVDEFEKRAIIHLDDGSGEGMEIVCDRPPPLPKSADTDISTVAPPPPATPDISPINVGSVIRAKGTIGLFRNTRQIRLKRIHILPDTMSEVRVWRGITKFHAEVLMRPWELHEGEVKELLVAACGGREGRRKAGDGRAKERKRQEMVEGGLDGAKGKEKRGKKLRKKGPPEEEENSGDENGDVTGQLTISHAKEERKKHKQKKKHRRHPRLAGKLDALGL
ncbi:MAG: hypothetical protein M1839_006541 [Geoglossum umbratile]|nr:MAG: hypothetical protein M1839_006541 [Geoglossum umbratile]